MMRALLRVFMPLIDAVLMLALVPAGIVMKTFRRIGAGRLPWSRAILMQLGVFPIRDHHYEPMFHPPTCDIRCRVSASCPALTGTSAANWRYSDR